MLSLDTLIAIAIVIAAALYLYRSFSRGKKDEGGGCNCASSGSCCNARGHNLQTDCSSVKH
jgi:hypothetical protein